MKPARPSRFTAFGKRVKPNLCPRGDPLPSSGMINRLTMISVKKNIVSQPAHIHLMICVKADCCYYHNMFTVLVQKVFYVPVNPDKVKMSWIQIILIIQRIFLLFQYAIKFWNELLCVRPMPSTMPTKKPGRLACEIYMQTCSIQSIITGRVQYLRYKIIIRRQINIYIDKYCVFVIRWADGFTNVKAITTLYNALIRSQFN